MKLIYIKTSILFTLFFLLFTCSGSTTDAGNLDTSRFGTRVGPDSVALDGEILVIGGGTYLGNTIKTLNDVWKSSDGGATWSEVK